MEENPVFHLEWGMYQHSISLTMDFSSCISSSERADLLNNRNNSRYTDLPSFSQSCQPIRSFGFLALPCSPQPLYSKKSNLCFLIVWGSLSCEIGAQQPRCFFLLFQIFYNNICNDNMFYCFYFKLHCCRSVHFMLYCGCFNSDFVSCCEAAWIGNSLIP